MRETRQSGSEGGGTKPIASPYPYNSYRRYASKKWTVVTLDFPHSLGSGWVQRTVTRPLPQAVLTDLIAVFPCRSGLRTYD